MNHSADYVGHQHVGIGNVEYLNPHSMSRPHYHNTYEIYLQIKGDRYITIENVNHHLIAGDLVLIEPYTIHLTESRESTYCKRYVMNIYTSLLRNILSDRELDIITSKMHTFIIHLDNTQFEKAYHILNNIYEYSMREDLLGKKLLYAATFEIMDFISRLNAPPLKLTFGNSSKNDCILTALEYVHNNYHKDISLDFISRYTNMSKSNFCLVFHNAIGETFVHYLNHVRISQAHRLICETKLPIKEIAEKTGFSSTSYMISLFRKVLGKTPGELRKSHGKSES